MAAQHLDVEHLFTISLKVGDFTHALIRRGPSGTRMVAPVDGGHFEGPNIRGTVVPPGGDWVYARENRVIKIDVRLQLVTDDGEHILMQYQGIGHPQADGTTSIRNAPLFETGAEKYAYLNDLQAVGVGTADAEGVTYDIYRLL